VLEKLKKIKKVFVFCLIFLMILVILLSIIEPGWIILRNVLSPPVFLLEINELLEIFGLIMLVVIGIELIETVIKTYLVEGVDHVRVVLSVALIAIVRKVIILDLKKRLPA
jgi:uncharacterized membrane protein (DUF373 family)